MGGTSCQRVGVCLCGRTLETSIPGSKRVSTVAQVPRSRIASEGLDAPVTVWSVRKHVFSRWGEVTMKMEATASESRHQSGWMGMMAILTGLAVLLALSTALVSTAECSEYSPRGGHSGGGHGGINWGGVVGGVLNTIPLVIPHRPPTTPGSIHIGPGGAGGSSGSSGPGEDWNPKEGWEDIGFDGQRKTPQKNRSPSRQSESQRSAQSAKMPSVVPVDDSHPENDGSIDARRFFMQVVLVMDDGLADFVWRDHKAALKLYQSTLNDLLKLPYKAGQIKAYLNLGNVYYLTGNFQEAVQNYKQALELDEAGGYKNKASLLGNIGCAAWASGEYESAEELFGEALAAYESVGDVTGQSNTLINVGVLQQNRGDLDTAIEMFRSAGRVAPTNVGGAIHAKRHIGQIYRMQGRFALSETAYLEALEISERIKNLKLQAAILSDLGSLYTEWGRVQRQPNKYWAAIESIALAIEISQRIGLPDLYLKKTIGDLYLEMGDDRHAESYLIAAGFNSSLGRLFLVRNDNDTAKAHFDQLLRSAQRNKRTEDLLAANTGLGLAYESSGDFAKAEKYYLEAMEAAEEIREGKLLSERWNFFAVPINGFLPSEPAKGVTRVRIKNGKKHGKIDQTIYPSEVTKARKFTDHIALKADLSHLNVSNELKNREDNLLARRASLLKARSLITRAQDPKLYDEKTKEINEVETKIKEIVDTLWQRYPEYASARHPKPVELNQAALEPDEYVIVFDVLGEAVSAKLLRGTTVERIALAKLNRWELQEQVDRLRKPLDNHQQVDPSKLQVYDVRLAKLLYDELLSEVLKEVPHGTSITIVPDESLGTVPFEALVVRGDASWQKEGRYPFPKGITYLGDLYPVNYHQSVTGLTLSRTLRRPSGAQDRLLVMADPTFDTSDPRLKGIAGTSGVQQQRSAASVAVPETSGTGDSAGTLSAPGERTMAPIAGQIRRKVAGGRDRQTPARVAARESSKQPGVEQARSTAEKGGSAEYVFTWPRLELTGGLGRAIKQMYPNKTDLYLGREADKSVLLNTPLQRYNAIVFGTHGYFGQDIPGVMEPVLVLSMVPDGEKGYLSMSEVMGLDLNADFVALTACKTGLGEYLVGEGVLSMGRAFQYAGAKSVLMSLWTVPEEASVALVESFMRNLKEGRSKADALAMARAEVRKLKKHYSHPFYWASFVLVGDAVPTTHSSAPARITKGVRGKKEHSSQDAFNMLEKGKQLQLKARSGRDYERAREQMEQALRLFERENSRKGTGYALIALADLHSNMGQYARASDYLTRYVRQAGNGESLRSQAQAHIKLGEVFRALNQYDKAAEQLIKALGLFEMVGDVGSEVDVLNRLGEVHSPTGRPSEAIGYLEKALTLTRNQGDLTGEARTLRNLASVNAGSNQYQKAIDLYQESLTAYQKMGQERDIASLEGEIEALQGLASAFRSQARYDLAIEHYNKALDLAKKAEFPETKSKKSRHLLNAYTGLGKAYEELGDLKKAEQYYSTGLKEAESDSRNAKKFTRGSLTPDRSGGLDPSEARKGLDRIKAKTEKKKAKTAAVPRR